MSKRFKYYSQFLFLVVASVGLACGCGKAPKAKGKEKSKTLILATVKDPPSLHPHEIAASIKGLVIGKWVFEGLTRLNLEGKYELTGAKKVEISPCQKRYTFTLRENFYHDGTPVSAYDYESAWKEAMGPSSPCSKAYFFYCIKNAKKVKKGEALPESAGVKALDENTLVVELEHPAPYFLSLLSSPLFAPFKIKEGEVLMSGPYMIDEWKPEDHINLKVNPFFWDRDEIQIRDINVYVIKDPMTALSLYDQGDIHWVGGPFNWLASDVLTKGIETGSLIKEDQITHLPFWLRINTDYFPLSSPLIRRALSVVINRKEITEHILPGDQPLFAPFPNAQFLDPTVLGDDDFKKGNALFEKGLKELGLTRETFPTLKLSSLGLATHKRLAHYFQERWQKALGIRVEIEVQGFATFYGSLSKGNYHIGGHFISTEHEDPMAYFELLSRPSNFSAWKNSEYEEALNALRKEKDPLLREELGKKAEEILHREMPVIWVANRSQYHAYRDDLKGICFDHRGLPDFRWAYFE